MNIKVNFDELDNVKNVMTKDKESFSYEVKRLLDATEKLRTIWTGDDADMFFNNAYPYIKRMSVIGEAMGTLGDFIGGSTNQYRSNEEQNSSIMKSEVFMDDEQQLQGFTEYAKTDLNN